MRQSRERLDYSVLNILVASNSIRMGIFCAKLYELDLELIEGE